MNFLLAQLVCATTLVLGATAECPKGYTMKFDLCYRIIRSDQPTVLGANPCGPCLDNESLFVIDSHEKVEWLRLLEPTPSSTEFWTAGESIKLETGKIFEFPNGESPVGTLGATPKPTNKMACLSVKIHDAESKYKRMACVSALSGMCFLNGAPDISIPLITDGEGSDGTGSDESVSNGSGSAESNSNESGSGGNDANNGQSGSGSSESGSSQSASNESGTGGNGASNGQSGSGSSESTSNESSTGENGANNGQSGSGSSESTSNESGSGGNGANNGQSGSGSSESGSSQSGSSQSGSNESGPGGNGANNGQSGSGSSESGGSSQNGSSS